MSKVPHDFLHLTGADQGHCPNGGSQMLRPVRWGVSGGLVQNGHGEKDGAPARFNEWDDDHPRLSISTHLWPGVVHLYAHGKGG